MGESEGALGKSPAADLLLLMQVIDQKGTSRTLLGLYKTLDLNSQFHKHFPPTHKVWFCKLSASKGEKHIVDASLIQKHRQFPKRVFHKRERLGHPKAT